MNHVKILALILAATLTQEGLAQAVQDFIPELNGGKDSYSVRFASQAERSYTQAYVEGQQAGIESEGSQGEVGQASLVGGLPSEASSLVDLNIRFLFDEPAITWDTECGVEYQVWTTEDLAAGESGWFPLAGVRGDGGSHNFFPIINSPFAAYRLQEPEYACLSYQDPLTLNSSIAARKMASILHDCTLGYNSSTAFVYGDVRQVALFQGSPVTNSFSTGVAICTGLGESIDDPNDNIPDDPTSFDDKSFSFNTINGDAQLQSLVVPSQPLHDVLVFQYRAWLVPGTLRIRFVYASEDYSELLGQFDDVFGIWVNNQLVASGRSGTFLPTPGEACTTYDGKSRMVTVDVPTTGGERLIKFAIADVGDSIVDSALFIAPLENF